MKTSGSASLSAPPVHAATSPLDVLANELGAVAGQIEREVNLRVAAVLADIARRDAERELNLTRLIHDTIERVDARLATVRDGKDGEVGVKGDKGDAGEKGNPGESIKGDIGEKGDRGDPGESIKGEKGERGDKGDVGEKGNPGENIKGDKGDVGDKGEKGDKGDRGDPGESVVGPKGDPGESVVGPKGEKGERGEKGEKGETIRGEKGEAGLPGERGKDGRDGGPGEKGDKGDQGPAGKLPLVNVWSEGVYYESNIVHHQGSTYQAMKDTGKEPGKSDDWLCIAAGGVDGRSLRVRGTYSPDKKFESHNIVACNGGSFVALKDDPGVCPGPDWQLIAGPGKRGDKGQPGDKGSPGKEGNPGSTIVGWIVNSKEYSAVPVMSDGEKGPAVELRGMFEQFITETR